MSIMLMRYIIEVGVMRNNIMSMRYIIGVSWGDEELHHGDEILRMMSFVTALKRPALYYMMITSLTEMILKNTINIEQ